MGQTLKTLIYDRHVNLGAQMVEFGGWDMPLQYGSGILKEHLSTRREAGLFDVSHMGRFVLRGADALALLQRALSNNAAALEVGESQYTMIPNPNGGAIDDAYLYRFVEDEYLLVVNAANRENDWIHLQSMMVDHPEVEMVDETFDLAMFSLQGPLSKSILEPALDAGTLPEPLRNNLSAAGFGGRPLFIARTGYTGEPLCFELFVENSRAGTLWDRLVARGAVPVGLGARDTLRLEAGLPLYGHELGPDPDGGEIPIFSCQLARFAVSLSPLKGDFVGCGPLTRQFEAYKQIVDRDYRSVADLPRMIMPVELAGKGVARAGNRVYAGGKPAGVVTSGTVVPYWKFEGEGLNSSITDETGRRAIGLALLDSSCVEGDEIEIDIRGKRIPGFIVPYHLRSEAPPYARAITCHRAVPAPDELDRSGASAKKASRLLKAAIANTRWRQQECINLIPSEQTPSPMTRMLSVMDPVCRYAEHKPVKAFCDADVFYYQGTEFIAQVEALLVEELRSYLGCAQVETRPVSGQMANTAVFSALVDFLNRADRKSEQRRIRCVLNNHIIKGGHLSAQPMGALRDFVARDPKTEKPAVVNFPVMEDNPYMIDVAATRPLIEEYRPELILLGKSMTLHREPVAEMRRMVEEMGIACLVMYDMAHVLGLIGPHFQEPFKEGADMVTGSTHKTYFGTQRGIVATNWSEQDLGFGVWEAIQRRAFPGSTSNHHLGTLLGLLMSAYEMNDFKDDYQKNVLANAKAFARALDHCGLDVAGDSSIDFTETHQVILNVGYAKGPEVARLLEENNIILNYQAAPEEEGFTASGSLRMGVSEMTRFGMQPVDFEGLAQLMADVILHGTTVKDAVIAFRRRFGEIGYCFTGDQFEGFIEELHRMI